MTENQNKAQAALDLLQAFNRKERYHLLRDAVIGGPFPLTGDFKARLAHAVGLEPIPKDADVYVAMDYHFDWIAAALYLAEQYGEEGPSDSSSSEPFKRADWHVSDNSHNPNKYGAEGEGKVIHGNQEDVDLLVAYIRDGLLQLLLVEAKVESGWSGSQLESKGDRVADIFGQKGEKFGFVDARFVLAGPPRKDGKAPAFDPEKVKKLPVPMFYDSTGPRQPKNMYRMELVADQPLYQPTRTSKKGQEYLEWKVTKSFPGKSES